MKLLSEAERQGFEPRDLLQSTVFKTAALNHSAIFPKMWFTLFSNAVQR